MSKMSESENAWSEELEDKLVTLWQERPCLFNCTMREYSNKVVIEKPGSTGNMKSCSYIHYTVLPRFTTPLYNATPAYRHRLSQNGFPLMVLPPLHRPPLSANRHVCLGYRSDGLLHIPPPVDDVPPDWLLLHKECYVNTPAPVTTHQLLDTALRITHAS